MPKDFNQQQYDQHFQQYLESNTDGTIGGGTPETRIELLKKYLPIGRSILEIGSGGGTDALLLQKVGYKVTASDYAEQFIHLLKAKGLEAVLFDAKHDELPFTVDSIYANAVFVHFSSNEVLDFLKRTKTKLTNERIIFFSVIKGKGYERSSRNRGFERDFYYFSSDLLKNIIENSGYKILYLNDTDPKWIQTIISS